MAWLGADLLDVTKKAGLDALFWVLVSELLIWFFGETEFSDLDALKVTLRTANQKSNGMVVCLHDLEAGGRVSSKRLQLYEPMRGDLQVELSASLPMIGPAEKFSCVLD